MTAFDDDGRPVPACEVDFAAHCDGDASLIEAGNEVRRESLSRFLDVIGARTCNRSSIALREVALGLLIPGPEAETLSQAARRCGVTPQRLSQVCRQVGSEFGYSAPWQRRRRFYKEK